METASNKTLGVPSNLDDKIKIFDLYFTNKKFKGDFWRKYHPLFYKLKNFIYILQIINLREIFGENITHYFTNKNF